MRIGVPREIQPGETRVALTPQSLPLLARDGHHVMIERGAGAGALSRCGVRRGGSKLWRILRRSSTSQTSS